MITDYETRRQLAALRQAARVAAVMLRHTAQDAEMGRPIDTEALRKAADDLSDISNMGTGTGTGEGAR